MKIDKRTMKDLVLMYLKGVIKEMENAPHESFTKENNEVIVKSLRSIYENH